MDVEAQVFTVRLNPKDIRSVSEFAESSGSYGFFEKDGFFVRLIGFDRREDYLRQITEMDRLLTERRERFGVGYLRLDGLAASPDREAAARYGALLDAGEFPFRFDHPVWQAALPRAFGEALRLFDRVTPGASESMRRNFHVRLLFWMETYLPQLFPKTRGIGGFPKLVLTGGVKKQEYLFLYLLVLLGCDVLCLNPAEDLPESLGMLLDFSRIHQGAVSEDFALPPPSPEGEERREEPSPPAVPPAAPPEEPIPDGPVRIDAGRFRRPGRTPANSPNVPAPRPASRPVGGGAAVAERPSVPAQGREPLDYETLASFAASVVMLQVYDEAGKCFKSGSGVFINSEGYILTNFHVVRGGAYFGVRLEEHEDIHYTQSLVKYHDINDLALLKIDVRCRPIPLYQGAASLRRGQQVLAIGSPLGLFNSVSDGIVSGFRKLDEVSMVQFTAPTSPGSSGGALLDRYGNLIGILTAGYDGQNLNLAVDYQTVRGFLRGFI